MRSSRVVVLLVLASSLAWLSCGGDDESAAKDLWPNLTVDEAAGTIVIETTLQREVALAGTWHLIVYKNGSNADKSMFITDAEPAETYAALAHLGGSDGDNVNIDNVAEPDTFTQGSTVEFTFNWEGADKEYSLAELFIEDDSLAGGEPVGLEMKFGGNYSGVEGTNPSDETGCSACLFSCKAGITSNASANLALHQADGTEDEEVWRYKGNPDLLPPDGTAVTVTMTLK